jgi:hypothetical protein
LKVFNNFAGLPPAIEYAGYLYVTTLPAAIIENFPTVVSRRNDNVCPIQQPSSIVISETVHGWYR